MSVIKNKDILFNILTSVPRVPFCKSGQKIIIIRQTIPPEKPPDVGGAAFTQLGPSLSPLRSPSGGVFSPPEFILWHYKDVCGAADNGDDIFFSPSQWSPSLLLWAKAQFASNSGPGFFFFFSHPCQTGGPALWRNESPGCLKAQPVSGLEGLAIHSLRIVLQATMGCMGAWPFVIGSVVNSCWGNKSVTHLWLWIRSSLFFFPSFFSLVSSETLPMAALATSKVFFRQKQAILVNTPEQRPSRFMGLLFFFSMMAVFECSSLTCDYLWTQLWLCCGTNSASPFSFPRWFPLSLHKSQKASVLLWHPRVTFDPAEGLLSRLWWPHPSN